MNVVGSGLMRSTGAGGTGRFTAGTTTASTAIDGCETDTSVTNI